MPPPTAATTGLPQRRQLRLRHYDYTQAGAYFVTLCSRDRRCLFGEIVADNMSLNAAGQIVQTCWQAIPQHFPEVELDESVVMPNHLHAIIVISNSAGAMNRAPTALGAVVRAFKARVSRALGYPVWQRNYFEHVIRDEASLSKIREYIRNNPAQWALDRENPDSNPP